MIVTLITACASDQKVAPCKGSQCKTTELLDNSASKQEWYCYGKENGGDWHCGNQSDKTKIVAIAPRKAAPNARPVASSRPRLDTLTGTTTETETIPKLTIKTQSIKKKTTQTEKIDPDSSPKVARALDALSLNSKPLIEAPKDYYTLQIIALLDEDKLLEYIEAKDIGEHIIANTLSQGSQWYVLLVGMYAGYSEAKNAQLAWSEKHPGQSTPWIRDIGSIQDALIAKVDE